jgi:hypothetical protein
MGSRMAQLGNNMGAPMAMSAPPAPSSAPFRPQVGAPRVPCRTSPRRRGTLQERSVGTPEPSSPGQLLRRARPSPRRGRLTEADWRPRRRRRRGAPPRVHGQIRRQGLPGHRQSERGHDSAQDGRRPHGRLGHEEGRPNRPLRADASCATTSAVFKLPAGARFARPCAERAEGLRPAGQGTLPSGPKRRSPRSTGACEA